jgi:hypothetical protein
MAEHIEIEGLPELEKALEQYPDKAQNGLAQALQLFGINVMNASLPLVPVDRGILRSSGVVHPVVIQGSTVYCVIGYGGPAAPYAWAVHENPRAGQTGGVSPSGKPYKHFAQVGEFKYLEKPLEALRSTFGAFVTQHVVEATKR